VTGGSELAVQLRAVLQGLLDAIDRADLDALAPLFCADATMYFPFRNSVELVAGAPAVLARFERMFADLRSHAARDAATPYVGFRVERFECHALDARHALACATLAFADQLGQRTLVMRREDVLWRILHVHASNLPAARAGARGAAGSLPA
jgi:hypothetical protein